MASYTPPNRSPLDEEEPVDATLPSAGRRRRASASKSNSTSNDSSKGPDDDKLGGSSVNALPTAPKSPKGSSISSPHRSQSTGIESSQPLFSSGHHAMSSIGLGATSYQARPKVPINPSSEVRDSANSGLSSSNSSLSSASSARTGSVASGLSGQREEQNSGTPIKFQSSSTSSLRSASTNETPRSTGSFVSRSDSAQSRDSVPRRSSKPSTTSRGPSTSASSIGSLASISSVGSTSSAPTVGSVASAPSTSSAANSNFIPRAGEWRPITNLPVINFLQIKGRTVREWSGHRDGGSGVPGLIKPFAISFCTGSRDLLSKIANEADNECWGDGNSDLHYYLERTWHRATDLSRDHSTIVGFYPTISSASGNVSETVIQSGSPLMILFHTGLLSKSGNGFLYGVLAPYKPSKSQKSPPMWIFTDVHTIEVLFNPRMMEAKQLYGIGKHQLPLKVWYWSSHVSELYYDPGIPIEDAFDANHLFGDVDSDRRTRIPPKYRSHTKEELLGRLRESVRRMKLYATAAPRTVIPQFFWDKNEQSRATTGHLQMLLPISLDYSKPKEIDCCAVLRKDSHTAYDSHHAPLSSSLPVLPSFALNSGPSSSSGSAHDLHSAHAGSHPILVTSPKPEVYFYRIISIYSISMAYANARLIQPVDAPWLLQGYLKMTGQSSSSLLNTSVGSLNSARSDYLTEQSMQLSSGWSGTGFASSNSTGTDSSDLRSDTSSHADSIISSSEASEDSIDSVASISAPILEIFDSTDSLSSRTASTSAPSLAVPHTPGAPHVNLANARFTPQMGRKNNGKPTLSQRAPQSPQPLPCIPESPAIPRKTELAMSAPISSPKATAIRIPPNFSPQGPGAQNSHSNALNGGVEADQRPTTPQGGQKMGSEIETTIVDSVEYSTIAIGAEQKQDSGSNLNIQANSEQNALPKANSSPEMSRRSSASSSLSSSPQSSSSNHSAAGSMSGPLETTSIKTSKAKTDFPSSARFNGAERSSSSSSASSMHSEGGLNGSRRSGSEESLVHPDRFDSHSDVDSGMPLDSPLSMGSNEDGFAAGKGHQTSMPFVSLPAASPSSSMNNPGAGNQGPVIPMYIMTPAMLANLASGKMVANMFPSSVPSNAVGGAPTVTIQAVKLKVVRQASEIRDYSSTGYVVLLRVIRHWIGQHPHLDPLLCELGQIAPHIQRFLPELKGPGRCLAYVNQACAAGLVEMRSQGKQHFVTMTTEGAAVDTSSLHSGKRQTQQMASPSLQASTSREIHSTSQSQMQSQNSNSHRLALPSSSSNFDELNASPLSSPSSTEAYSPHSSSSPSPNQSERAEKPEKTRQKSSRAKLKRSADNKTPKRSGKVNKHKKCSSLDPSQERAKQTPRTTETETWIPSSPGSSSRGSPNASPSPNIRMPPTRRLSDASGPSSPNS